MSAENYSSVNLNSSHLYKNNIKRRQHRVKKITQWVLCEGDTIIHGSFKSELNVSAAFPFVVNGPSWWQALACLDEHVRQLASRLHQSPAPKHSPSSAPFGNAQWQTIDQPRWSWRAVVCLHLDMPPPITTPSAPSTLHDTPYMLLVHII